MSEPNTEPKFEPEFEPNAEPDAELTAVPDPDTADNRIHTQEKCTTSGNLYPYHEEELRSFLHDLHGPLACALGFTEELAYVRQSMQNLVKNLNDDADSKALISLRVQIDDEMEHCLSRINRSLVKLDSIMESMRTDTKSTD